MSYLAPAAPGVKPLRHRDRGLIRLAQTPPTTPGAIPSVAREDAL